MQRNKISFNGQKIFVGIDVHKRKWSVATSGSQCFIIVELTINRTVAVSRELEPDAGEAVEQGNGDGLDEVGHKIAVPQHGGHGACHDPQHGNHRQ